MISLKKDATARYRFIDMRLRMKSKPAPTLQDLIDYVSSKIGKTCSMRVIQNDIYNMRYDEGLGFEAPIAYDRYKKAYYYTEENYSIDKIALNEEDLFGLDLAINILQQFKDVPAIKQFEDAIARIASSVKQSRTVHTEQNKILLVNKPNKYAGVQYMQDIVDSIREKTELQITYQSFTKPKPRIHTIQPYFVKEYNGRLYLIANDIAPGKMPKLLTFAFDRLVNVFTTTKKFKEEKVNTQDFYNNVLGVSYADSKPEKIVLRVNKQQLLYLKTQPIHSSQKVNKESDEGGEVELTIGVNTELRMLLLSFGANMEVLEPPYLREEIKSTLNVAIKQYK
jgi:predicted DNA-binding transcriptional regulator YafY